MISSNCPDQGVWRGWLDHEQYDPQLDAHLQECPACTGEVALLRENSAVASGALRSLGSIQLPSVEETEHARQRLAWRQQRSVPVAVPAREAAPTPLWSRIPTAWRIASSGIAAALILTVGISFTDEGRAAAAAFLAQFRSQQVAAIEVSPQSQAEIMRTMQSLGNLGTFRTPSGTTSRPDAALPRIGQGASVSLAEASQRVGFPLQTPDPATLPAGLDKTPQVQVIPANEIRYTFDKAKAATYLRSSGHANVTLPDKFDGATLIVSTPAAALLSYSANDSHQALIIGQSGELVVSTDGKVTLDELRDFLLGLPGLPKETTDQLRLIRNWNQTLPIPIPIDKINWKTESFKGNQGLLLNDNTGVGSAAIWHANGHLYGVAGSLRANDLKRIADSIH